MTHSTDTTLSFDEARNLSDVDRSLPPTERAALELAACLSGGMTLQESARLTLLRLAPGLTAPPLLLKLFELAPGLARRLARATRSTPWLDEALECRGILDALAGGGELKPKVPAEYTGLRELSLLPALPQQEWARLVLASEKSWRRSVLVLGELHTSLAQHKISAAVLAAMPLALYQIVNILDPALYSRLPESFIHLVAGLWCGSLGMMVLAELLGVRPVARRLERQRDSLRLMRTFLARYRLTKDIQEAAAWTNLAFDDAHPLRDDLRAISGEARTGRSRGETAIPGCAALLAAGVPQEDVTDWFIAEIDRASEEQGPRTATESGVIGVALLAGCAGFSAVSLVVLGWATHVGAYLWR